MVGRSRNNAGGSNANAASDAASAQAEAAQPVPVPPPVVEPPPSTAASSKAAPRKRKRDVPEDPVAAAAAAAAVAAIAGAVDANASTDSSAEPASKRAAANGTAATAGSGNETSAAEALDEESVPTLQDSDPRKPDRILARVIKKEEVEPSGSYIGRYTSVSKDGAAIIQSRPREKDELVLAEDDRYKLKVVLQKLETQMGVEVLSLAIPDAYLSGSHAQGVAEAEEEDEEMEDGTAAGAGDQSTESASGAATDGDGKGKKSTAAGRGGKKGKRKGAGWTTRKQQTKKSSPPLGSAAVEGSDTALPQDQNSAAGAAPTGATPGLSIASAVSAIAGSVVVPASTNSSSAIQNGTLASGKPQAPREPTSSSEPTKSRLAPPLPPPVVMLDSPFKTLAEAFDSERQAVLLIDVSDFTRALTACLNYEISAVTRKAISQKLEELERKQDNKKAESLLPPSAEPLSDSDRSDAVGKRQILLVLSLLDRLLSRLAKKYRDAHRIQDEQIAVQKTNDAPASRSSEQPASKEGEVDGTVVKKEDPGEQMLLALAKADAKARTLEDAARSDPAEQQSGPKYKQFALHMRLTGSDYFTNAVYLEEDEALKLDTGEADLVQIQPTSRRDRKTPVPTLGQRVARQATRRQTEQERSQDFYSRHLTKLKPPSFLYYGPYSSFTPTYDSTSATISHGASVAIRNSRRDLRSRMLRKRWQHPDPEGLLDEFEEEEDDIVEDDEDGREEPQRPAEPAPAPPEEPAAPTLPAELLQDLDRGLRADALQKAFAEAHAREQIGKKLQENAHVIIKLQQLQWERLRAHEKEWAKDPLFRDAERYLLPDERESELAQELLDSLVEIVDMNPQPIRGRRRLVPRASTLTKLASSNVIDPALCGGEVEKGFWGTMPPTMPKKMPRVFKDGDTARTAEPLETNARAKYALRAPGMRPSSKNLLSEIAGSRNYEGKTIEEDLPAVAVPVIKPGMGTPLPPAGRPQLPLRGGSAPGKGAVPRLPSQQMQGSPYPNVSQRLIPGRTPSVSMGNRVPPGVSVNGHGPGGSPARGPGYGTYPGALNGQPRLPYSQPQHGAR